MKVGVKAGKCERALERERQESVEGRERERGKEE